MLDTQHIYQWLRADLTNEEVPGLSMILALLKTDDLPLLFGIHPTWKLLS
jgi:hypothetical protein